MFLRTCVLKICSKFTGQHSRRSVISIKLRSSFIEMTLRHVCSPVNLLHIFRTPFTRKPLGVSFCNIDKLIVWCISAKENCYNLTKNSRKSCITHTLIVYSYSYLQKVLLPAFTIPEIKSERKISLSIPVTFAA